MRKYDKITVVINMNFECFYRARGADKYSNIKHNAKNRFEIMQIFCNKGNVLAGSKMYPMITGALYLIDCSKPQCTLPSSPGEYIRNKIILDTDVFSSFLKYAFIYDEIAEAMEDGGMCIVLDENSVKKADACFYNAFKNKADATVIMLELLKIILLARENDSAVMPHDTGIIGRTIEYIDKNLSENTGSAQIAKYLHISKYHLCHVFKEKTGMTISEYTLEKRLAESKKLLAETDKSISEISMDMGFSSFSYFCSIFKARNNMTPGEFRKRGEV